MTPTYEHDSVVPYQDSTASKKEQVAGMFNGIAKRYDFLNRFLSAGIDVRWRKKALQELNDAPLTHWLDVATGTADVAIMAAAMYPKVKIIGVDISEGMLEIGAEKLVQKGLQDRIQLQVGDSEALPFNDQTFDAVTVAFGVRNFQNLETGLREIKRVLRPGGKLVVLEFSKPKNIWVKIPYTIYMKFLTPFFGKLFSKDKKAYAYLDESIQKFPEGEQFLTILHSIGFTSYTQKKRSFGICTIYSAVN